MPPTPTLTRPLLAALAALVLVVALAGLLAWRLGIFGPQVDPDRYTGIAGTVVRFASVERARQVLQAEDDWTRRAGDLQRALLAHRPAPVDDATFRRTLADSALRWPPEERERWRAALERIAPTLNRLALPWPEEILLVHTDGRESDEQPHTRGAAVVIPRRFEPHGFADSEVLAHELFHVLSRHREGLADPLYALLGYAPVSELSWPAAWAGRRIANQDAPLLRHAMRVVLDGRPALLMPVVVADPPAGSGSLQEAMDVRLLEVDTPDGGARTVAVERDGEPAWQLAETPEFLARLGGNTDYVLHPEETIADNFMFLVTGRAVRNPALLQRIEQVLRADAALSRRPPIAPR